MVRKIIHIDKEKCNGCGLCADACHEGAIGMVAGKAELLRDDYCDGLGDCLPACPTGAITFEEREAAEYDKAAVEAAMKRRIPTPAPAAGPLKHPAQSQSPASSPAQSQLAQWPVQIKLTAVEAPCFDNAGLLVVADCSAYAYANFHEDYMRGKVTLIGCPKLDNVDYSEKLTEIIRRNHIRSLTVVRMEVPCCGGIEHAALKALEDSGKRVPWEVVTLSVGGVAKVRP